MAVFFFCWSASSWCFVSHPCMQSALLLLYGTTYVFYFTSDNGRVLLGIPTKATLTLTLTHINTQSTFSSSIQFVRCLVCSLCFACNSFRIHILQQWQMIVDKTSVACACYRCSLYLFWYMHIVRIVLNVCISVFSPLDSIYFFLAGGYEIRFNNTVAWQEKQQQWLPFLVVSWPNWFSLLFFFSLSFL